MEENKQQTNDKTKASVTKQGGGSKQKAKKSKGEGKHVKSEI